MQVQVGDIYIMRACILDMDGVVVETESIHTESFRVFLNKLNIPFTEAFLKSLVGYSAENNMERIRTELKGGDKLNVQTALKERDELYLNLLTGVKLEPEPGILSLISYCQKNAIKLALASSSGYQQVKTIIERLFSGQFDLFNTIVTGDDVEHKKPAPDIYQKTVNNLSVPAKACLAFEDSGAGVRSAKAAGVYCFAIRNPFALDKELGLADKIIDSVQQAVDNDFWGI
jgi:HAD superfamily hydrolase (TIGR01509 family)